MRYPKDRLESHQITIDPEFAALIPAPTADELRLLEENILEHGILIPLAVWTHYYAPNGDGTVNVVTHEQPILLDGHNRLKIVQKFSVVSLDSLVAPDVPIENLTFADRDAAMLWIEENQLGRRNLTDDQRAMIAADVATRRSKFIQAESTAKARAAKDPTVLVNSTKTEKTEETNTRRDTAKEFNLSESKLRAARELTKKDPKAAKEVRDGKKTLRAARKNLPPKSVKGEEARIKKIVDGALKRIKPEDTLCILQAMEQSFDVGNNILLGDALPAEKTPLRESRKLFEYLHTQLLQAAKGKK